MHWCRGAVTCAARLAGDLWSPDFYIRLGYMMPIGASIYRRGPRHIAGAAGIADFYVRQQSLKAIGGLDAPMATLPP